MEKRLQLNPDLSITSIRVTVMVVQYGRRVPYSVRMIPGRIDTYSEEVANQLLDYYYQEIFTEVRKQQLDSAGVPYEVFDAGCTRCGTRRKQIKFRPVIELLG